MMSDRERAARIFALVAGGTRIAGTPVFSQPQLRDEVRAATPEALYLVERIAEELQSVCGNAREAR